MENFKDCKILVYQYLELARKLENIPEFTLANIIAILKRIKKGEYPERWLNTLLSSIKADLSINSKLNEIIKLFEKLRDLDYPFDEEDVNRHVFYCLITEAMNKKIQTEEDRNSLIHNIQDFYDNEAIINQEKKQKASSVEFWFDDPEADFLESYTAIQEEVKTALKVLRESDQVKTLGSKEINYNSFFEKVSKILAQEIIQSPDQYNELKDTNKLVLFIQDLYEHRNLIKMANE